MISHAVLLEGLRDYTSGADGLVVNFSGTLFGLEAADFANSAGFWPIVWTAAWVAGLAVWAVRRSRLGAILRATRQNEERMRFSGFDTYGPRLAAFVLANVIAGACGLLHVLNSGFVSPESLGLGRQHQRPGLRADRRDGDVGRSAARRSDFRLRSGPIRRTRLHAVADGPRDRGLHRSLPKRRRRRMARLRSTDLAQPRLGGRLNARDRQALRQLRDSACVAGGGSRDRRGGSAARRHRAQRRRKVHLARRRFRPSPADRGRNPLSRPGHYSPLGRVATAPRHGEVLSAHQHISGSYRPRAALARRLAPRRRPGLGCDRGHGSRRLSRTRKPDGSPMACSAGSMWRWR